MRMKVTFLENLRKYVIFENREKMENVLCSAYKMTNFLKTLLGENLGFLKRNWKFLNMGEVLKIAVEVI